MNPRTLQFVLELERPAIPDEALQRACRRAQLDRSGLDFTKVRAHPGAEKFLQHLASAYDRGYPTAARAYARQILKFKGELK